MHLSDTELYGNLFLVNMAGFETTATVLTYTLALLAANREIQDWVGEEVDAVWGRDELKCLNMRILSLDSYAALF